MAEVFIAQTRPVNADEQIPRKPADPVRVDQPLIFTPAPQPILNSDAAVIMRGPQSNDGEVPVAPAPVSIGSVEATFTPSYQPVTNQNGAGVIYGDGPMEKRVNLPPPPSPIATNLEVKFTPGPAAISNSDVAIHTRHEPPVRQAMPIVPMAAAPVPPAPATNEQAAQFIPGARGAPLYNHGDTFIPAPPTPGFPEAPKSDVINVGQGDVQILPGRAPLNVNGDITFGGGGNPMKMAGSEDVSFLGRSAPISVGGTDVYKAPSMHVEHQPGQEDRQFAPSANLVGNQETTTGAKGEPTANLDYGVPRIGEWGIGKPKNVKG